MGLPWISPVRTRGRISAAGSEEFDRTWTAALGRSRTWFPTPSTCVRSCNPLSALRQRNLLRQALLLAVPTSRSSPRRPSPWPANRRGRLVGSLRLLRLRRGRGPSAAQRQRRSSSTRGGGLRPTVVMPRGIPHLLLVSKLGVSLLLFLYRSSDRRRPRQVFTCLVRRGRSMLRPAVVRRRRGRVRCSTLLWQDSRMCLSWCHQNLQSRQTRCLRRLKFIAGSVKLKPMRLRIAPSNIIATFVTMQSIRRRSALL